MLKKYYKTSVVHKKNKKTLFMYENCKNRGCAKKIQKAGGVLKPFKKSVGTQNTSCVLKNEAQTLEVA